jgi:adenosylhomocysteine nucleosidase
VSSRHAATEAQIVVMISALTEWEAVRKYCVDASYHNSPFGEWCCVALPGGQVAREVVLLHGGWGKIAAAASTQYVIDRWKPRLLVNLGTCGGIDGAIEQGTVVLVDNAVVYDIVEQMGDPEEAIAHYTTELDLSWLAEPYPMPVCRGGIVSADRDLIVEELPILQARHGAVVGDWESGAIAYVATRNQIPCLILRGVTDVVGNQGDDCYGNFDSLPQWLDSAGALFLAA